MKKLTVTSLALGNIKHRKKRYVLMVTGILLSMIFSSGVTFFISSLMTSVRELRNASVGSQDVILANITPETVEKLAASGLIAGYGTAEDLGTIYTDETGEIKGTVIAKYDADALRLSCRQLTEGRMPAAAGEIAVERDALLRMKLSSVAVGDTFTVKLAVRDGLDRLPEPVEKTYVLTGILRDQRKNMERTSPKGGVYIPAAVVSPEEKTEAGGKSACILYYDMPGSPDKTSGEVDRFIALLPEYENAEYFKKMTCWISTTGISGMDVLEKYSFLAVVLAGVLMIASCIGIVNTFRTDLRERRTQTGLLRAVGATKRQLIRIYGRETLLLSLICAPVSTAVSYFAVKAVIGLMGENFVFAPRLWVLPLCAAVSVICVMCASLIPLAAVAKTSPMLAIRSTDYNRKLSRKKIRSEKSFAVPKLLASREMTFGKGRLAAVSLLLTTAILLSTLGFSWVKAEFAVSTPEHDYEIFNTMAGSASPYFNEIVPASAATGIRPCDVDDAIMSELVACPYVGSVAPEECRFVNWLIEAPDEMQFMYLAANQDNEPYESAAALPDITKENYAEKLFNKETLNGSRTAHSGSDNTAIYGGAESTPTHAEQLRERFGYEQYILPSNIIGMAESDVGRIDGKVIREGRIDIDKLNSGEEILLVLPDEIGFYSSLYNTGHSGEWLYLTFFTTQEDEKEIAKRNKNPYETRTFLGTAERTVHAGDEVELSLIYDTSPANGEYDENDLFADSEEHRKTVRIGAILTPGYLTRSKRAMENTFVTTTAGYESFGVSSRPTVARIDLREEPDEQTDEAMQSLLGSLCSGCSLGYSSAYEDEKETKETRSILLSALTAVIILAFSVCAAMINNSLTARIRENRRQTGTLRAVGASLSVLAEGYIRQLIRMFVYGVAGGYGLYNAVYFIGYAVCKKTETAFTMEYFVLPSVLLCAVVFAVCAVNMIMKIKEQTKNSIVDNIREL